MTDQERIAVILDLVQGDDWREDVEFLVNKITALEAKVQELEAARNRLTERNEFLENFRDQVVIWDDLMESELLEGENPLAPAVRGWRATALRAKAWAGRWKMAAKDRRARDRKGDEVIAHLRKTLKLLEDS